MMKTCEIPNAEQRQRISNKTFQGEFWKPCPGTNAPYYCCGYQIITPGTGCGMYCRYCVLQAYFENHGQTICDNFGDLERELHEKMASRKGIVRFGTGEFGDSLYLDHQTEFSVKIAALLQPYNAVIEYKTKSTNIGNLSKIKDPGRVIIGFSLNTPAMIALMERGTAPLDSRLDAARRCVEMGFYVAFHFDPMFRYEQSLDEYRMVVRKIFDYISKPEKIAYVSMGGFRTMPSLKSFLKENGLHVPLFSGEMINGADGKLRYFRPVRTEMYRAMREEFDAMHNGITLYMCMESPEVWDDSGMRPRIPDGLVAYLDKRAEAMIKGK